MARATLNKVILIGFLGTDPEVRYTPSGTNVTRFRLATENAYMKNGERRTDTEWHTVVAWDKLGEQCGKYLTKGRQVYVEGRLRTRSWEGNDGLKRQTTEIVANMVLFLGGGAPAVESVSPRESVGSEEDWGKSTSLDEPLTTFEEEEDDIPF